MAYLLASSYNATANLICGQAVTNCARQPSPFSNFFHLVEFFDEPHDNEADNAFFSAYQTRLLATKTSEKGFFFRRVDDTGYLSFAPFVC